MKYPGICSDCELIIEARLNESGLFTTHYCEHKQALVMAETVLNKPVVTVHGDLDGDEAVIVSMTYARQRGLVRETVN